MGVVALVTGERAKDEAREMEARLRHRVKGSPDGGIVTRATRVRVAAGGPALPAVALGAPGGGRGVTPTPGRWSGLCAAAGLEQVAPGDSDPEVVLCDGHPPDAYAMVAVWDDGRLLAARGPLGLRPLYYLEREGRPVAFASEMKALCPLGREVRVFPPGHVFVDGRFRRLTKVADLPAAPNFQTPPVPATAEAAAVELARLIDEAVERGYRGQRRDGPLAAPGAPAAPAPVAIFLSGGIDSSIVAAAAVARIGASNLRSFAVGAAGSADLPQARRVAEHLGLRHEERVFGAAEAEAVLEDVIYHLESFDPQLVRSSVANYLVARMAAEAGCRLAYCGEGGDELFAGYSYLKRLRPRQRVAAELIALLEGGHANGFQRVDRMTAAHGLEARVPLSAPDVVAFSLGVPLEWKIHTGTGQEKWLLRQAYRDRLPVEIIERPKAKFYEGSGIGEIMAGLGGRLISEGDLVTARAQAAAHGLRLEHPEQALYWRIFRERFPHRSVLNTIGWTRTVGTVAGVAGQK